MGGFEPTVLADHLKSPGSAAERLRCPVLETFSGLSGFHARRRAQDSARRASFHALFPEIVFEFRFVRIQTKFR